MNLGFNYFLITRQIKELIMYTKNIILQTTAHNLENMNICVWENILINSCVLDL